MPKGKIQIDRKLITVKRKFKLGGRKNTKSVKQMNAEDLQKVIDSSSRGKDKMRARNELARREGRSSRLMKELIETAEGMVAAGTSEPELVDELKSLAV